jgi:hypothetical protein
VLEWYGGMGPTGCLVRVSWKDQGTLTDWHEAGKERRPISWEDRRWMVFSWDLDYEYGWATFELVQIEP